MASLRRNLLTLWIVLIVALAIAGCQSSSNNNNATGAVQCAFPQPTADSQEVAGNISTQEVILPNGRLITPAGTQLKPLGNFPMNMDVTADGKFLLVLCDGDRKQHVLQAVKIPELNIVSQQTRTKPESFFYGVKVVPAFPPFDSAYTYVIFVGGGREMRLDPGTGNTQAYPSRVWIYGMLADGTLEVPTVGPTEIPVDRGVFVSAVEPDMTNMVLYVAYGYEDEIVAVDLNDFSTILASIEVMKYPYCLKLSKDKKTLFATNWGTRRLADLPKVSVVDVSQVASNKMTLRREVTVGKNPEGMALTSDGKTLYVADSETDDISVIDTATLFVSDVISLRDISDTTYGVKPTNVALSSDEKRLLVTAAGINAMEIIDLASNKVIGSIPVAWWPTTTLEVNGYWYILNGKGEGSGPNINFEYIGDMINGTLSQVPASTDEVTLAYYTAKVRANNLRQLTYFPAPGCNPIQQLPIKHIVYILKENKTYDEELGDFAGTNGDVSLCTFCCNTVADPLCYTPNLHGLAQRFVNLDNFYADAEVSMTGHMWNTSSDMTDYVEKMWQPNYRDASWFVAGGVEPASFSKAGFIFGRLDQMGIPFKNYGEVVGSFSPSGAQWSGVVIDNRWPLTFDLTIPDKDKVQVFIEDLQRGDFPPFVFMLVPNDHTSGCSPGAWHPDSLVADNDAGLGMIVDAISHSPFWNETLIFVTEDDTQGGADHVDAHRTIGLAISPWVKTSTTISTHYSWPNFYKTLEMILGLPPMSDFDLNASPMYDIFSTVPDPSPYAYLPQTVPMVHVGSETPEMHQCGAPLVARSLQGDFTVPDNLPYLGEILWQLHNESEPFPGNLSQAGTEDGDGDDDGDAEAYINSVRRMLKKK